MCRCTPEIKTPWCGKPGCEAPAQVKREWSNDPVELMRRGWRPTARIRWFRPPRASDNELVLQQLWEYSGAGEPVWVPVETHLAD